MQIVFREIIGTIFTLTHNVDAPININYKWVHFENDSAKYFPKILHTIHDLLYIAMRAHIL